MRALGALGLPVRFGVLSGSYAKGRQTEESDIDLVVVSSHFDAGIKRDDINLLWRTAARTDCRIEPVPCGEKQWEEDTGSALLEIARREGFIIALAA